MSFNNFTFRHLSPEDRATYQRELLRMVSTRNESLARKWAEDRVERVFALKTAADDFGGEAPGAMAESIEQEYEIAGRMVIDAMVREVQA